MQVSSKFWKFLGFGLALLVVVLLGVRTWVVPALIVGQIQSRLEGRVTIRDWWLNGRSAGVVGLTVHDGPAADSPVLASIDRVETDLSLGGLLRGRLTPGRVSLERPVLTFRLARDGRIVNLPRLRGNRNDQTTRLPAVTAEKGEVTFQRAGDPDAMVIHGLHARVQPDGTGQTLRVTGGTEDPSWGRWDTTGTIDLAAGRGDIGLRGDRVEADPKRLARVPFVPADVWSHVQPRGPVDVAIELSWSAGGTSALRTRTAIALRETSARFPSLGIDATGLTGRIVVEGAVVRVNQVRGRSIDGEVAADGTMNFASTPARIDLDMRLSKVNVADSPRSWRLEEAGITGLLTGRVQLRAALGSDDVDLSGSSGEAVVEKASIQGIPVKSLRLAMHAHGDTLEYDTKTPAESSTRRVLRVLVAAVPWLRAGVAARSPLMLDAMAAEDLVALQAPPSGSEPAAKEPATRKGKGGVHLPQSITTQMELEDVDLAQLIVKAQFLAGFPFPIPITGKLTLKATATIPLGNLHDVKQYAFHGDATLKNASVFKVDFRKLAARLDLADGLLELNDLRGALADRPDGGPDNPPAGPPPDVPEHGPLPAGGFRGNLRAQLSPPGPLSARFEGSQLPVGELAAPMLPRPTPLAGLASMNIEAQGDLGAASDPAVWSASGQVESVHITYRGASLDQVLLRFALKQGHLDVPELAARLAGRPLAAQGAVDLKPPYAFRGKINVTGWNIASVVALIPTAPHPSPVSGSVSARAEAEGTASPLTVQTQGEGRVDRFQAGPVLLGDVPFRWATEGRAVGITIAEAHPFGGRLSGKASVPIGSGQPTEGSATFTGIDTAAITATLPGEGLKLTGKADGGVSFLIPSGARAVEAKVRLSAPDLTVQGVPAEHVQASLRAHQGTLKYELTAESLGGKLKFLGDFPLSRASPRTEPHAAVAQGEARVVGFTLKEIWRTLSVTGLAAQVTGEGALDANIRDVLDGPSKGIWARGILELRDLNWNGRHHPGGHLRGIVTRSPTAWRIDPLNGELLGGSASGSVWGTTPPRGAGQLGFNLQVERATLSRMVDVLPVLARNLDGYGSLKATGSFTQSLRTDLSLQVEQGRLAGLPLNGLRLPAEIAYSPARATGALNVRHWSARLAGGQVRGDASVRFGEDRSFHTQVQLSGIDLQTISRIETESTRPPSGRISGRIALNGPDFTRLERYRGRVDLELSDASLISIPVFREIDRFLGAARGGLFEQGALTGAVANRAFIIDVGTLEGRLVQLHATGTIGFDTQLNLEVLVNTNQIIPETGQALVERIPGLREVLGRSDQAMARVGTYLSNKLIKLRVTGTLRNPSVSFDPSVAVAETAVGFFAGVLKLPLGFIR